MLAAASPRSAEGGRVPSAISNQQSAMSNQQSAISNQQSAEDERVPRNVVGIVVGIVVGVVVAGRGAVVVWWVVGRRSL